ncbi:LPS export ABC transporter permease LptF [Aestuariibius sp. 2305UL40-4]|uniref:LPS export ABC transporter permease LptF n=1 Tax=Aestuariibius violaceus TaxID=3234132 RepID=UPI00345E2576
MARIDRYVYAQLMILFGFFSLILVLVYWVNRAVLLFDQLIADGQSAGVFLEFTALSLPNVIRLVLPISAFAASVYVTNRMSSESELAVLQATGHGAFRLARPVLVFGLTVTFLMSVLVHVLTPLSLAQLNDREAQIAENLTARLLVEGEFLSPANGITVYIREIAPDGTLNDVFLSDTREPDQSTIYTAERAFLVRGEEGPQLVMLSGLAQTLESADQRLFTTRFEDFTYNLGEFMTTSERTRRSTREISTWDLFAATPETQALTRDTAEELRRTGHIRVLEAGLSLVAALIGFSTLLAGGFSRFGIWRHIVIAIFLLIAVKALESAILGAVEATPAIWPLIYLPFLVGCLIAVLQLLKVERPGLFPRGRAAA